MAAIRKITLRDVDNRDDAGAPFEFTNSPDSVVSYIDGPLRRDLRTDEGLDDAVAAVRAGDLATANAILNPYSVYLSWSK